MRLPISAAFLLVTSLFCTPPSGVAQSILVRVSERDSGAPVFGAFVSLLNEEGETIRSALTNETGRYLFPVSDPGVFQVKAELIGRKTQVSPMFRLAAGESHQVDLELPVEAIPLEGIDVEASRRCQVDPTQAPALSRLWNEAKKALTVQAWTERAELYRYEITSYERDLDRSGRKVEREDRRSFSALTRTPIGSLPVEDLISGGFIRSVKGGGYQYFLPDADALLSDLFLQTHCFRLNNSEERPTLIGLSFEPAEETDLPDVVGTLWLNARTSALEWIDFGYTWAPQKEAEGLASGHVEFTEMPNGSWIVDRWWIRVPILAQDRNMMRLGYSGIWVAGVRESGGEVTRISTVEEETIAQREPGSLSGVVWDSTTSQPLRDATVYLVGTEHFGVTDQKGEFLIGELPQGVYSAEFSHPRLDTLDYHTPGTEVEIGPGEETRIELGIPSLGAVLTAACKDQNRDTGASVLAGFVKDEDTGEPIPGASVRFEWQEVVGTIPTVRALNQWFEVQADGEGRYTACGVPLDEALVVRASLLGRESDTLHLRFMEERFQTADFLIRLPSDPTFQSASARISGSDTGIQGVQGTVVDPESGQPIPNAEVSLQQDLGGLLLNCFTDESGSFTFRTPSPGEYVVSVGALGFSRLEREEVRVLPGEITVLDVQLPPNVLAMEPLIVSAERRVGKLEVQGFYDRQQKGLDTGIFLPPEVLEERQPRRLSDLFFELPGTRVIETVVGGRGVYFRSGERFGQDTCWPMVFVDRHLVSTGGFISAGGQPTAVDDLVPAFDVSAVEVYRGAAEIPPEFNGPNGGCGVIVIWTKTGGGL